MTPETTPKKCLDCGHEMRPIRVIDHSMDRQAELAYASIEKTKSWFTSYYREEGKLISFMCEQCGSIRFFGQPFDQGTH
ncbi:MAG: hypothetical protein ACK58L_13515 [Planctomycetota bacterium]